MMEEYPVIVLLIWLVIALLLASPVISMMIDEIKHDKKK
jgi:uncharacterized membrane protein YdfJ with MMPL/SSD domain